MPLAVLLVYDAPATVMHELCSTVSTTLQTTIGGLALSQDMILGIPHIADCHTVLACQEQLVNDVMHCANKQHINFDYQVVQNVLKYDKILKGKLKNKTTGPFEILWVHCNGIVRVLLRPHTNKFVYV